MNKDATLNENSGPYLGMERFKARKAIWADMEAAGLVIKEEPYLMNVPRSQRGGEIVEPLVSTQWFVKMDSLAEMSAESVRNGEVKFVPERFTKVFLNWMDNIQDWCISRQLWWGHRIPVWYCQNCHEVIVAREDPTECPKCGSVDLKQDPDVLDTWFSSGLWPFSVFGWPEETRDFRYFYPTSVMETGYDIIFFWVARMVMDGLFFTGKAPFHTVYLHGMVRDDKGQKMSKTKNNVIDPLVLMNEYGTDALRFSLVVGSSPGNDQNVGAKKVEANRNFANKVWNIGRFVINAINNVKDPIKTEPQWTLADSWIWSRTRQTVNSVNSLFESYQFGEAGRQVYEFLWNDFADWYLEASKRQMAEGGDRAAYTAIILADVLGLMLRLLHPFTPYVTEALYGYLKEACETNEIIYNPNVDWAEHLIVARWPERMPQEEWEESAVKDFELIQEMVRAIRNLRSELKLEPNKAIDAILVSGNKTDFLNSNKSLLIDLAGLNENGLQILPNKTQTEGLTVLVIEDIEVYLDLTASTDGEQDRERLEKELTEAESHIARLEKLLSSPFAQKAPANVVDAEREKLAGYKNSAEKLRERLNS
jgi:valyl-tRNA synthetase